MRTEPQVLVLSEAAVPVVQENCLRCHADQFMMVRLAEAAEEGLLHFGRRFAPVFVPEAAQEDLAFLVGEAFMRAEEPGLALAELFA